VVTEEALDSALAATFPASDELYMTQPGWSCASYAVRGPVTKTVAGYAALSTLLARADMTKECGDE
jgi:hypothetical protein